MGEHIRYRGGYKYQLAETYATATAIAPTAPIRTDFIELSAAGKLTLRKGYAWDGPSGPTFDTLNFMRGSLVHDALYQLMWEGHLSIVRWKDEADRALQRICREDGMSAIRAWWVYEAVKQFGKPGMGKPEGSNPVVSAPK